MVICSADRVSAWHVHPSSHGGHLGKDGDLFELFRWNLHQAWHDIQVEKLVMMKPAELLLVTFYILAAIILQLLAGQRWGDNAGHDDVRNGVPPSTFTRIWHPVRYASSDIRCHVFCLVFVNNLIRIAWNSWAEGLAQFSEESSFHESVQGHLNDTEALLELYKASQVHIMEEEPILENICSWSAELLKQQLCSNKISRSVDPAEVYLLHNLSCKDT